MTCSRPQSITSCVYIFKDSVDFMLQFGFKSTGSRNTDSVSTITVQTGRTFSHPEDRIGWSIEIKSDFKL